MVMYIPRHKVFISYYHQDDQWYKDYLISLTELNPETWLEQSIFEDYSVHENEIDDTDMSDEQIRREIRDNYIADATVLVLLCGENTKRRKHIDWEIHAAMYDSNANPKMGILVIDLPSIAPYSKMLACSSDEEQVMGSNINWVPASKNLADIQRSHPYLPDRIATNLTKNDVSITIASWDNICNNTQAIKLLIDNAFKRRKTNNYDHSAPLRRKNS